MIKCAFELAKVFCVDSEVGLQGLLEFDAFGHVDETAAREGCAVERREFIVRTGDDFAEVGAENLRILFQTFG